jgi:hypothetical protein
MKKLLIALALVASSTPAIAQGGSTWQAAAAPLHYFSAATTNSTLVMAGARILSGFTATNTTTTVYYLKFYDKATAPTCNTDVPVLTLAIPSQPAGTTAGQIGAWPYAGFSFINGLGFCITGAAADNDNTSAATGVTLSLGVK